jgi:uncharacterized membrane protein
MSAHISSSDPISAYLNRVSTGLKGIEESQRQEIVAEIRSHLADRVQQLVDQGSPRPVEAALAAMGDPDTLALQFTREVRQQQSSRSFAPWVLLRAAARIALTGINGTVVFLIGVFGYGVGFTFTLAAFLKTIMPSKVGLWVGPNVFVWGMPGSRQGAYELAGQYFIPVSLVLAFLFASVTTLALRWLMRSTKWMRYFLRKRSA